MSKKLLIIGWVWPEPKSSAAGSRMLQLIEYFQQLQFDITFASPAQTTEHMQDLESCSVSCQAIALNDASFDDFIAELQPDAVMYDRYMMEEQFGWRVAKVCPKALRILDTEDLQSLRNARHQAHKQGLSNDAADLNTDLAIREVSAIYRCDLTIMISQAEIDLLTDYYKVDPVLLVYCPFIYDEKMLQQTTPDFQSRTGFMSIGNFRHAPNWDAVLWLRQSVWPLIRKQLPTAQLSIYGAYPPKKATDLHSVKEGFLVKGWVDDALVAMKSARVCLAPLRFGAGQKGKLAEAMICGTPSVTTAIGAEGMHGDSPWGGSIKDDAQHIADAAVELYQKESLWLQARDNGLANASALFSKTPIYTAMNAKFNQVIAHLEHHRKANFIGAMLNHHSHRSTQFMSQWIEAKNKLEKSAD